MIRGMFSGMLAQINAPKIMDKGEFAHVEDAAENARLVIGDAAQALIAKGNSEELSGDVEEFYRIVTQNVEQVNAVMLQRSINRGHMMSNKQGEALAGFYEQSLSAVDHVAAFVDRQDVFAITRDILEGLHGTCADGIEAKMAKIEKHVAPVCRVDYTRAMQLKKAREKSGLNPDHEHHDR